MAKADALTQLKDIHLPAQVGWWPLAPGWYAVLLLLFIAVITITYKLYKRQMNARPKKQALLLLHTYVTQYEQDHNAQLASARISELLKRVALVYYPRAQVASIYGEAWITFLNQTSTGIDFQPVRSMLLETPFQSGAQVHLKPLIRRAELWIKQRRVPCLN